LIGIEKNCCIAHLHFVTLDANVISLCWIQNRSLDFCPKDKRKGSIIALPKESLVDFSKKSKKLKWNFIMIIYCV
jgi:hypothetical protein